MQSDNDIEMPEAVGHLHSNGDFCYERHLDPIQGWPVDLYTADQLRAAVLREREKWQADADRYQWLRDKANDVQQRAPMAVMVDSSFSVSWRDALYGSSLDAAIDQAMSPTTAEGGDGGA